VEKAVRACDLVTKPYPCVSDNSYPLYSSPTSSVVCSYLNLTLKNPDDYVRHVNINRKCLVQVVHYRPW
jgi:hypothetical protein